MDILIPYATLSGKRRVLLFVLLSLLLLNLAVIFGSSLMSPEASGESSSAVGDFLESVLPEGTPTTDFILVNLRKIAHFAEFAALGAITALLMLGFAKKPLKVAPVSPIFGLVTGFTDETIQIFSGRGPDVRDVWIDLFGYLFSTVLIILTYIILALIREQRKKGK